jgi:hypothetical protein
MTQIAKPKVPEKQKLSVNENGDFVIPDHLRCNPNETEKLRL